MIQFMQSYPFWPGKRIRALKAGLAFLFFTVVSLPFVLGFQSWQSASLPAMGEVRDILPHPLEPGKLLVASSRQVFAGGTKASSWQSLWSSGSRRREIRRIAYFNEIPGMLFVLTSEGVFRLDLKTSAWQPVYRGASGDEQSVYAMAVDPEITDHWLVGTGAGLFETDDAGKSWFRYSLMRREPVHVLRFAGNNLYMGTPSRLFVSDDASHFKKVFSSVSGSLEAEPGAENPDESNEDPASPRQDLFDVVPGRDRIWLASRYGVYEYSGDGSGWKLLPTTGLLKNEITHLVYGKENGELYAGTAAGLFAFHSDHWEKAADDAGTDQVRGLAVVEGEKPAVVAATAHGFVQYPLLPEDVRPDAPVDLVSPDRIELLESLIRLEPSMREVQQAVVRHNHLKNSKIDRWHFASRLSAFLPNLSFGKDFSRGNNIDVDRGATTSPDEFIQGPDDIGRKWDMNVSWDLGDFIWSSNQTAIDSRDKLMAELRQDLLSEATRVYYERRRLQTDLIMNPPANRAEYAERLLRIEELAALIDGLSGGYFGDKVEQVYQRHPEYGELWKFSSDGRSPLAAGGKNAH